MFTWSDVPPFTAKFALIMDDEISPCGTGDNACKHWTVLNIPSHTLALEDGVNVQDIDGVIEGQTYIPSTGYAGPCPPSRHTYNTTIYALNDSMPDLAAPQSLTRSQFSRIYAQYILGSATIRAYFSPQ